MAGAIACAVLLLGHIGEASAQTATTTTVQSSLNPSDIGQSVTFTARVDAGGVPPTGPGNMNFTFSDGAFQNVSLVNGVAIATRTFPTAGNISLTATYSGNANFLSSLGSLTQVVRVPPVNAPPAVHLECSNQTIFVGQTVTCFLSATDADTNQLTYSFDWGDGSALQAGTFSQGSTVTLTHVYAFSSPGLTISATVSDGNTPVSARFSVRVDGPPADSTKLGALQTAVTPMISQASGQAISGAVGEAIGQGFAETNSNGGTVRFSINVDAFNFAPESTDQKNARLRGDDPFAAMGYARRDRNGVTKAPNKPSPPQEWLAWVNVSTSGLNTGARSGDISGTQTNALAGLTRMLTPNSLVGVFGGYERFDYSSQILNGSLKGDGWTVGGYFGWRLLSSLRFDAGVAYSTVSHDALAGLATTTFGGNRWLGMAGFTGTYRITGFVVEPSARVLVVSTREDSHTDSLGTLHSDRGFLTGRASFGGKIAYPWLWAANIVVSPYAGLYADYYFNNDNAVPLVPGTPLPSPALHGASARIVSGVTMTFNGKATVSLGGEYGGIGNDYKIWSVRGRAAVPF